MRSIHMRKLVALTLALLLTATTANARLPRGSVSGGSPFIGACPVTSGPLTLAVTTPRSVGISPLLVFFDATGTTDTSMSPGSNGLPNTFQDVTYKWTFGDSGASGTGTWANGSNPGVNSMNASTGPVAAHLYITSGADQPYTAQVTATDGTNVAQCNVAVTAFDPIGSSGFPGTATTCVAESTLPVAGSGGCPAGAAVATQTSFSTAVSSFISAGKRLLLHCGDTFTDAGALIGSTKWSIDEYGSCTGSNRPIITLGAGLKGIDASAEIGDGRISNLDFECTGSGNLAVWFDNFPNIKYQMTWDNLNSNGCSEGFGFDQGAQMGFINDVITGAGVTGIAAYFNFGQTNPVAANAVYTGHPINNLFYQAALGNSFSGVGSGTGAGVETFRIGAGHFMSIENNTLKNANSVGAVLKLHEGDTNGSCQDSAVGGTTCATATAFPCPVGVNVTSNGTRFFATISCWTGELTAFVELSDNLFTGNSGGQLTENAPENANVDERLQFLINERNYYDSPTTAQGGIQLLLSAVNETVRDNVFNMTGTSTVYPEFGMLVVERGGEPIPSGVEVYNNTGYIPVNTGNQQVVVAFTTSSCCHTPGGNSVIANNMQFSVAGQATVLNAGSGNTSSNNTTTTTANPSFTDGSGSFSVISDFKPTANFSGALNGVPVFFDALGVPWPPTWDLGAVHH